MLLRVFHEYEFTANTPVHRRAICCFYDLEIRVYNNSVGGTFSQHRAPSKRNPLEIFIKKVHGESMSGEGGEARIHHRYTRPVINSRPMPYPLWYPSQPCTYRYTSISLPPPPVPWIFALARTEIRARTKEGSLERMHELSPVKYCSGFLRVWRRIAVNARERRYSILPRFRLIYRSFYERT